MGKFIVLNKKTIVKLSVTVMVILCFLALSMNFIGSTIEVVNSNRLLPIYSVETDKKQVAITFDCAWGADDIPTIIEVLRKNDVKATFFVVGDWVNKNPEAVQKINQAEMEIGNHTLNHAHVAQMTYEDNLEDMKRCNELIEEITNKKVRYYRGAYGEYSNEVIVAAEDLGMQVIQWDVDALDYTGKTPEEMCERIRKKIRNGSIILMHNDTKYTASGLQEIINCVEEEGYEIISLEKLVHKENYEINHEGRQILVK